MMHLLDTIGNTPLIELKSGKPNVQLLAKLEGVNPGGSVKDRAAYNMILQEMRAGNLQNGDTVIEATSGNTGIALSMVGNLMGINISIVMPENSTQERILTMKAYGADVILTPAEKGIEYSRSFALKLANEKGYKILNQFDNPNNWQAHYQSTGPEIWNGTHGKVTHFVSAMGTTGTIMGVSRFLKEKSSGTKIVGAQPAEGAKIPGIRKWSNEMIPRIFSADFVDQTIDVEQSNAETHARLLAKEEGIFAGISSGGAYYAALQVINEIESGCVVFIVCDRGDRYLSSGIIQ